MEDVLFIGVVVGGKCFKYFAGILWKLSFVSEEVDDDNRHGVDKGCSLKA